MEKNGNDRIKLGQYAYLREHNAIQTFKSQVRYTTNTSNDESVRFVWCKEIFIYLMIEGLNFLKRNVWKQSKSF